MKTLAKTALSFFDSALDKIVPDADQRDKLKIEFMRLEQNGDFRELEIAMQAIVMEAQSKDPWTSRARPTFLYVMYIFILFSIPIGVISVFFPVEVKSGIEGMKLWLEAIPGELYTLFGLGFLGYVKKRSDDKAILIGKEPKKLLGIF